MNTKLITLSLAVSMVTAWGQAADELTLVEKSASKTPIIINHKNFAHSSSRAPQLVDICRQVYSDVVLSRAEAHLETAAAKVAADPDVYRKRLAVVRDAFEFVKLQVDIMNVMKRVRDSGGTDEAAIQKALALCEEREARIKARKGFFPKWYRKRVPDHMGPPSKKFRQPYPFGRFSHKSSNWCVKSNMTPKLYSRHHFRTTLSVAKSNFSAFGVVNTSHGSGVLKFLKPTGERKSRNVEQPNMLD